jgi:ubiquitin
LPRKNFAAKKEMKTGLVAEYPVHEDKPIKELIRMPTELPRKNCAAKRKVNDLVAEYPNQEDKRALIRMPIKLPRKHCAAKKEMKETLLPSNLSRRIRQ